MAKKLYNGQIPFRKNPKYTNYTTKEIIPSKIVQLDYDTGRDVLWKDNILFIAKLEINGMSRGRSAANFSARITKVEVTNDPEMSSFLEGINVNIFMVDMLDIVTSCNLYAGATARDNHVWTFCKRGSSYGITRVV